MKEGRKDGGVKCCPRQSTEIAIKVHFEGAMGGYIL
jgi:hypothetical protein